MMKEKYISEAALKDEPKKKLSLKIKEGSITPEHFNKKEVDAYLLDVVGAIEETGMLPEDKAKLDALPTAEELEERFGKIFIVNVEGPTNRENREYIADKTYQETFAALTENKTVAFNTTYGVFFANADTSSPVIFASKYYAHDSVSVISRAMLLTYTETSGIRIESVDLQKALTFDTTPTQGSNNPVSSDGVYQAIQAIDVSSQISGKLDKTEAAELYQPKGDYLTEHQDISGKANVADVYTQNQTDTLLNGKQNTISNVTVAVDANTGTPAGTVTFSNNTLAFDFQNLKGEKGDTGERGAQGVQGPKGDTGATGPQGPKGDTGVSGDASSLAIIHGIDKTSTYTTTDVCGADAAQALLNEIEGGFYY